MTTAGCRSAAAFLARRRRRASRSAGCSAIPALRVQHHYLAFVTLAFNTLVFLVFRNEEWLTGRHLRHRQHPAADAARLVDERPALDFYFFCLAHRSRLLSLATWWLIRSPWGRAFTALRENPIRAEIARRRHARATR